MKKATKVTLIFALIFFIVGIGLTVFGFYKNDWRTDNLSFKYESKTYTSEEKFNKIETNLHNSNIRVVKGETFSVIYDESEKYPMTIAISDGALKVSSEKKSGFKLFQWHTFTTTIIVPYDLTDINVKTLNGKIEIKDFNVMSDEYQGNINVETSNGKIVLEKVEAKDITLRTKNGKVNIDKVNANKLDISSSNGKIYLKNSYVSSLKVGTGNGDVYATNTVADIANFKTSNGDVEGIMTVRDLTAKTSNGKIVFTVYGDKSKYTIRLKGSNHNENSTGSDSTYIVDCETSNGKCNVSFTQPTIE